MTSTGPSRTRSWRSIRWPTALIGLILIVVGQFQLASEKISLSLPLPLGLWLNKNLYLAIPSIDNVLRGLPIMLVGGILLAIALRGLQLMPVEEHPIEIRRFAIHLIRSAWPWVLVASSIFVILLVQLGNLDYRPFLPLLWIVTLLIFIAVMAVWDHRRQVSPAPQLSRQDLLWLIGLLIAGLLIGTYRLAGWPDQLIGDEGNFWTTARDIAIGAFHPAIFDNGVYSFPIFSSILQAWVLKLFGIDLWGWRFGSVLMGVLTVIPLYLLAQEAFDRKTAIVSSIVLISSPYFLVFARLGYNNIQALFITVLALYWLYIGLQRSSNLLTFLAGCACGLGFYTFFSARGTVFIALGFIAILWLTRKFRFKQAAHAVLLIGLGMLLTVTPYFVYGIHQNAQEMDYKAFETVFFNTFNGLQFYTNAELFKYAPPIQFGGNELFFNPPIYLVLILRGLIRSLLVFQKPWLVSEHYLAFPLAGTVGAIFYVIGLFLILKTIKQPRSQLILLWFLTEVIASSVLPTVPPRHTLIVALIPALAIMIGLGIIALMRAASYVHVRVNQYKNLVLAALLGLVTIGGLIDYFVTSYADYPPQPDQIMSWASLNSHGEHFIYIYSDPSQAGFRPYTITEFLPKVSFEDIPLDQFVSKSQDLQNTPRIVLFYPPNLANQVIPVLMAHWGGSLIQRMFYSVGGTPVLAAGMNTPFVFERDRPIPATLLDSLRHPAFLLFLALLALVLATVSFLPAVWISRLPVRLRPLTDWFNRPEPSEPEEALGDDFEQIVAPPLEPVAASLADPPEWAGGLSQAASPQKPDRYAGNIQSDQTAGGRDIYIHIHIPSIQLPRWHLVNSIDISLPPVSIPGSLWLILSVLLAVAAQILVARQSFTAGGALYLLCIAGLTFWAWKNPKWRNVFANQLRLSQRAEWLFLLVILVLAAFLRFHDLAYRVYGLEADETKWTIQSWYSTILRVNLGEFATMHYQFLPVDFWVRSIFLRLFGMNFVTARLETAVLSLLSVFFLYLLVRKLTFSPPLALLAALLYSIAFVELNASHQALAETSIEVWMMAGITFFVFGLQDHKWWQFQVAGVLLALGMMTYETFFPTTALVLVYAFGLALYRILKKKDPVRRWLQHLLLLVWPVMLVFFESTKGYLAQRSGYHLGWLLKFSGNGSNIAGMISFFLRNTTDLLQTIFSQVVWPDSLLNWPGPYLNPLILPFVVIGLIYNLWNIRRPLFALLPLWYLIDIAAAPLLLGSVWPRVLYPGLAPLIIWGAMGLWTLLGALRSWFDSLRVKLAAPVFALFLVAILINDYHIFSTSLLDPIDRQKRRELADLTAQSASRVPMILFPYESNQDDSLQLESQVIIFSVAGARHVGLDVVKYYAQIDFAQLLPTLWQDHRLIGLDMFFDKAAVGLLDQRKQALNVVLQCYPGARLEASKQFFDVYHFDAATLAHPKCYEGPPPVTVSPQNGAELRVGNPVLLRWDTKGTSATSYSVLVDQKIPGTYVIEAEDAFQGNGWYTSSEFVNGFSGSGFLLDQWQAGKAQYTFDVPQTGQYKVWIRSYKRRNNDQHNFINLNGQTIEFAKTGNLINEWVWEDLGTFDLAQGSLPITLSRTYGSDEEYSVFIDTLLITTDLTHPASQVKVWQPLIDTGEIQSSATGYTIPQALAVGDYRWAVRIFDGDALIDSSGARGVESTSALFTVQP